MMIRYFYISTFSLLVLLLPIQAFSLDKTHNLEMLRGAMLGTDVTNEDILEFGQQWNANLVRWQLNWSEFDSNETNITAYWTWILAELDRLDEGLEYSRTAGLKVVVDLHTAPGGRDSNNINEVFKQQHYLDTYYEVWEAIATRYKGNTTIWAFDLLNEPLEYNSSFKVTSLDNLMTTVAGKIRDIDPDRTLIVEPGDYGAVDGYADFTPINYANVVYSVHMYEPIHFTHQGLSGFSDENSSYPGIVNGKWWDKTELKNALAPVLAFQKQYDVPIYVGEFSAIRWAPNDSAYQYIKDCIEIFEEYGWDWTYHAFREWQGWSVEYLSGTSSEIKASSPTDREELLKFWYAKNNKPQYFYSIHPDGQTRWLYETDLVMACELPVLLDDQSLNTKVNYDVIWSLDSRNATINLVYAMESSMFCSVENMNPFKRSEDTSGYTAFFDQSNNQISSDGRTLNTCALSVRLPPSDGQRTEQVFDVSWKLNGKTGQWSYDNYGQAGSICKP